MSERTRHWTACEWAAAADGLRRGLLLGGLLGVSVGVVLARAVGL